MRTTEAARYARWAAAAAILLAVIVAGVFARRSWQARQVEKSAPPVPAAIQQRSAQFSFSKVEKDRTLFTVRASRATEFKEGNRNELEDVWITIYGSAGQRLDNIHTHACEYISSTGRITCAGEVQMDLQSAQDARSHPAASPEARVVHVATSNVSFDRETGAARTDQPVVFRFPYGQGRGVGATYSSQEGLVRLERNVELTLSPSSDAGVPRRAAESGRDHTTEPIRLTGGSLEYRQDAATLRLLTAVHATQANLELSAGELALELDDDLRAKRLVAMHRPELRSSGARGQAMFFGDEFVALFRPEGWTERILAKGNARGDAKGPSGEDHIEAQQLDVEMVPRKNRARLVTASGNVKAQSTHGSVSRRLETATLRLWFAENKKAGGQRLERAESPVPATVEWTAPSSNAGKTGSEITRVRGQQMAAEFDQRKQLRTIAGHNGVEIERQSPGRRSQTSSSREFIARFGPDSSWTEIEQTGSVRLREADRTAQGDRAKLERATDIVTLTGSVVFSDATSRTTAQSLTFNQRTGETRADGGVRSSELSPGRSGVPNLAPQPANISSEHLVANSQNGRALYYGTARLWQGDSVVQADSIELLRETRQLKAQGDVQAVFPQAAGTVVAPPNASAATNKGQGQPAGPEVWHFRAGTLTYWSGEDRARLEQDVRAESRQAQITSRALELFFAAPSGASGPGAGGKQVTRAVATGGVTVREGDRRATGDRAVYTAAEGKFVISGGHPTIYDAFRGTTTGRQLTFYFVNDTIVVDSEEGSRTLTRHRVEK